ncbi:MAG: hypothetical protein E6G57_03095 [Actinobacteria bacterium]|nr:MAG: hypothetical protein E6G57_03095 [Actinomycetota bacterium]
MGAVAVVIGIVVLAAILLTAGTWWWARTIASRMKRQDAEFRPLEAKTDRCAACDGVGTRLEALPGWPQGTPGEVRCYRCGGTGLPPTKDHVPDLWPTPLGLTLRRLRHRG